MAEKFEELQRATERMVEDVVNKVMRPLQKEAFLCSAQCCDSNTSVKGFEQCTTACNGRVQQAEQLVTAEIQGFQARLQRCAQRCQDVMQDRAIDVGNDTRKMQKLQAEGEACIGTCADDFKATLPKIYNKIAAACKR
ncbi:hypothetical protein CYMTET_28788 [Cymbomonas tetramitiformis]|uniref:Protein FAM136A n=1 Tax=Cymbomonas tetramitiformis TaxID=36881 RepID=A0AAE0KVL4_9CHLO|nr:hypothetical protein CYMTET_28788 [Cymbomonas tetramitiformis]